MDPVVEKILFAAIGVIVPALITWLGTQIVKYKKLTKKEEDEMVKTTIENTLTTALKPIQSSIGELKKDVGNMKKDIGNVQSDITKMKIDITNLQNSETNFSTRLNPLQDEIEHLKDDIQEILDTLKQHGVDLNNVKEKEKHLEHETRCAWRYRIRTLCHAYIRRGWMTHDEFEQLQEMFNLYTAIGGNGQTKELYERTMRLDVLTDAEAASLNENE